MRTGLKRRRLLATALLTTGGLATAADGSAMDKHELDQYYRVFSDTCYLAPTDLQEETLAAAEDIYQLIFGWHASPPGEDVRDAVANGTRAHWQALREQYPAVVLRWDGSEGRATAGETLAVTRGLLGLVLVELHNDSPDEANFEVYLKESGPAGRRPVMIPAGQMRPMLVPYRVAEGDFSEAHLVVVVTNGEVAGSSEVAVPVAVSNPVVVKGVAARQPGGTPCPSRVYARGSDGILRHAIEFRDNTTLSEKPVVFRPAMMKIPFFYTSGEFEVTLPPGEAVFTLERGYETPIVSKTVVLEEGQPATVELVSDRERDMMSRGWISGDTHIHWAINAWNQNEDIDLLAMVQRAEDLRVANNLTLYQYLPDGNSFTEPSQFPPGPVEHLSDGTYHVEMGEEFRNDNHFGHINLLNLEELIHPIATGQGSGGPEGTPDYPLNKHIIEEARAQDGISIEAHNLGPFNASGVAVNVINGYSDSLDQLEPQHYYNFLNCGVHIGLSNGSDHPARLAGICRVYVNAGTEIDYDAWTAGLAQGRTFTTSGPLLELTVDGAGPGSILNPEQGKEMTVRAEAWSRYPVGNLQIVSNGEVIASSKTDRREAVLSITIPVDESRWFVARCSPTDDYNALVTRNAAHTSAVYAEVNGEPVLKQEAAQVWLDNIAIHRQRLIETATFTDSAHREEALEFIDEAVSRYRAIADRGSQGGK